MAVALGEAYRNMASVTQLLGTPEYCNATVATAANITLRYRGADGQIRTRQIGLRWFSTGAAEGAPWVVRLVVDNCGLQNEYPVRRILQEDGSLPLVTVQDADEVVFQAVLLSRRRRNVQAQIGGTSLLLYFHLMGVDGTRSRLTLDVRRRRNEGAWERILEQTPAISAHIAGQAQEQVMWLTRWAGPHARPSITQLLGREEYCNALVMLIANVRLRYRGMGGEGRVRRVGLRWFVDPSRAPWVVRLVVDNCGLDNEFPVVGIHLRQGEDPVEDVGDAHEIMLLVQDYVAQEDGPVTVRIDGNALLIGFPELQEYGSPFPVTLDVRRTDGDGPWEAILDQTPGISECSVARAPDKILHHLRLASRRARR
jgi:hypothetical protein